MKQMKKITRRRKSKKYKFKSKTVTKHFKLDVAVSYNNACSKTNSELSEQPHKVRLQTQILQSVRALW